MTMAGNIGFQIVDSKFASRRCCSFIARTPNTEKLRCGPLKVGILGNVYWRALSRSGDPNIPRKTQAKADLDVFIDEFLGADLIIQMGDLADGMDVTFSDLKTELNNATDHLENLGGSAGNGLDAQVEYILGNDEYAFAGNQPMSKIYSICGWSGLSDTYRVISKKGVNLALLNWDSARPTERLTETTRSPPKNSTGCGTHSLGWKKRCICSTTSRFLRA